MTSRLMSQQRSKKGQASLPRSLPVTPERTRSALRGDGTLQFVSMSQNLTRCCRLTVHKSVPAVRIHLAPPPGLEVSRVSADDDRSGGAELRRSEALLAAVRQKPGCKCNKSDDRQKNGRICEGVERLRQLLHWPDLPFVLNQSTPPDLHCKEVEIPRFAGGDGAAHPGDTLLEAVLLGERPTAH